MTDVSSSDAESLIPETNSPRRRRAQSEPLHAFPFRMSSSATQAALHDPARQEQQRRRRWIQINTRFQIVIACVAVLFSLLLFAILLCWIALAITYFTTLDQPCDVPTLRPYFWLATLQLVLDVFRTDILKVIFQFDVVNSQLSNRIPCRVLAYNVCYVIYAIMVLRLGIKSLFYDENNNNDTTTCPQTAPQLYKATTAFLYFTLMAWATILFGYLLPFCVVAALLTFNGYNPTNDDEHVPVFPAAYSHSGAPPGTIDELEIVTNVATTRECCICMEHFKTDDTAVETPCKHVFHKHCAKDWLRQARTCPVCRTDVVSSNASVSSSSQPASRIPLGPTGRPVVGLIRLISRSESGVVVQQGEPAPPRERSSTTDIEQQITNRANRAYTSEF